MIQLHAWNATENRYAKVSELVREYRELMDTGDSAFGFADEPSGNGNAVLACIRIAEFGGVPVIRTILPQKTERLGDFLNSVINMLNETYKGKGRLVLAIGSTSERERKILHGSVLGLADIAKRIRKYPASASKLVLEFQPGYDIDTGKLLNLFPPEMFAVTFKSSVDVPEDKNVEQEVLMLGVAELKDDLETAGYEIIDSLQKG